MNIERKFWSTYVHDHYIDNGCPLGFLCDIPVNNIHESHFWTSIISYHA